MNNANLYIKSNAHQKQDAKAITEEFVNYFNWRFDGSYALLDIGCGPGDVLYDLVLPKIPINTKVIGVDISKDMIKYANENYGNENLSFYKMDIEDTNVSPLQANSFNLITSFYCLHWIQNQR